MKYLLILLFLATSTQTFALSLIEDTCSNYNGSLSIEGQLSTNSINMDELTGLNNMQATFPDPQVFSSGSSEVVLLAMQLVSQGFPTEDKVYWVRFYTTEQQAQANAIKQESGDIIVPADQLPEAHESLVICNYN